MKNHTTANCFKRKHDNYHLVGLVRSASLESKLLAISIIDKVNPCVSTALVCGVKQEMGSRQY